MNFLLINQHPTKTSADLGTNNDFLEQAEVNTSFNAGLEIPTVIPFFFHQLKSIQGATDS